MGTDGGSFSHLHREEEPYAPVTHWGEIQQTQAKRQKDGSLGMAYKDPIIDPGFPGREFKASGSHWEQMKHMEERCLWGQLRHLCQSRRPGGGTGRKDVLISTVNKEGT